MKARILLCSLIMGALMSHEANAQSDLGLKRIGATIGYVSPEDLDGTFGFGVFADLGTITPTIGLDAHLDYWSESQEDFGTEVSIHDIVLGARGKYYNALGHHKEKEAETKEREAQKATNSILFKEKECTHLIINIFL